MIHSLAALAKSKVAIAAVAATLAAGGGVGAKAAITGNANPFNWGHQVSGQVVTCKQALPAGKHGIGMCVSDFAKQNGVQERQRHSQAGSHPTGAPTTHPTGPPSSHPTGPPSSHPTGSPTTHPSGPPSSHPTGSPTTHPSGPPTSLPPTP